jgi:hypothetical protein
MKSNEITEGIWDDMKSGYKAGKQDYIRKQAEKMGMTPSPSAAPAAAPEAPFSSDNPLDHIEQLFKNGKISKTAYDLAKGKLAADQAVAGAKEKKSGFKVDLKNQPKSKGFKTDLRNPTTPTAASTPTTPKAGDPVPGMSGHVYSGEVDARGRPRVKPAPAAPTAEPATASSTLPTKAKSKTKPKDIDIDAALKMADSLSPDEKKKLLQNLLKSGVKVSAGGA